jgi:arylsulfatase A-like enzyme
LLAFRECKSGKVSIESVRFVSEREEKLKDPSGQQWAGLADIFHAALVAKTPESIRIPVRELPAGARLDFSYGTKEDAPVKFKVTVAPRERAKESAPTVVFERTVTIPNRWQSARIDLSSYAGKSVLLEFSLASEQKGLWGYWGSPTVRTQPAGVQSGGGSQAKRKPHGVIFLVTDTLRKDHLNIYGYHRETVIHLKKFADEGVAFRHAISQGTWTKVSVPSMMTSLYPLTSTVLDMEHSLPASAKTIAEVFRDEGYATVAYSSVPFTGKANNMHQGYDELHESGSISDRDYNAKTSRHYVDRLIAWLKEHGEDPFFVFLHVFDPHSPFRPRPPYDTLWGAPGARERMVEIDAAISKHKVQNKFGLPHKDEYVSKTGNDPDELLKIYKDWYDGSIRGMDAEIGRLLEALREMGLDQDTLMVWGADHGEEFWEHNQLFHGQNVYGELNQVPLVFRWPNSPEINKGVMIDHQVQNLDIMPTILELAGIQGPTNMQGRSLVPLLNGRGVATWQEQPAITQTMADTDPPPGSASSNKVQKAHFGIIERNWKLVRKEVDPEALQELYEHPVDHLNLTNVIKSDGPSSHVKPLHDTLEAWKARAQAAQLPNDETMTTQLSSEELRRLRALGYVGGGTTTKPATNKVANTNAAGDPKAIASTNAPAAGPNAGPDKKEAGH